MFVTPFFNNALNSFVVVSASATISLLRAAALGHPAVLSHQALARRGLLLIWYGWPEDERAQDEDTPSSSLGQSKRSAFPWLSYRTARPTRCTYVSASSGASSCNTQSTTGKSSPRATRTVERNTACLVDVKRVHVANRVACFCFP